MDYRGLWERGGKLVTERPWVLKTDVVLTLGAMFIARTIPLDGGRGSSGLHGYPCRSMSIDFTHLLED